MAIVFSILIVLACIILILAVLIQNPKGGGLASGFQGGAQMMGVRRTADFLEKATWSLAIAICVVSVGASAYMGKGDTGNSDGGSVTKDNASKFGKTPQNAANPFGGGQ